MLRVLMVVPPDMEKTDEGMKNLSFNLSQHLQMSEYITINSIIFRNIMCPWKWRKLRSFNPDIVHYMMGPSSLSFIIVKFLMIITRAQVSIISAPNPQFIFFPKIFLRKFTPNLILTQSKKSDRFFKQYGIKTILIPNGVDLTKFHPIDQKKKSLLACKYKRNINNLLVLHVGHIKRGRNLEIFKEIREKGYQVIIVGSTSTRVEKDLEKELIKAKCKVWRNYIPNIEEIYQLADCYVFSVTTENNAIEIPISILEAAACNLPVITTDYGGLKDFFPEDNLSSFFYYNDKNDLFDILEKLKNFDNKPKTRKKVEIYSWEAISKRILQIYLKYY